MPFCVALDLSSFFFEMQSWAFQWDLMLWSLFKSLATTEIVTYHFFSSQTISVQVQEMSAPREKQQYGRAKAQLPSWLDPAWLNRGRF